MLNRALKIQVVKTDKNVVASENDISVEAKYALAAKMVTAAIDKLGKAAITYVLVDTLRQVVIAKATNK